MPFDAKKSERKEEHPIFKRLLAPRVLLAVSEAKRFRFTFLRPTTWFAAPGMRHLTCPDSSNADGPMPIVFTDNPRLQFGIRVCWLALLQNN